MPSILPAVASQAEDNPPVDFILGTTKPNASNTGIRTPTTSVISTNFTITTNNTTYQNVRFDCIPTVRALNVSFIDCHFRGGTTGSTAPLVKAFDTPQAGVYFYRCTFTRQFYAAVGTGAGSTLSAAVSLHTGKLERCDISGSQDGVWVHPTGNVQLLGNYIHDLWFYSPDLNAADRFTHNDLIQLHNGPPNVTVMGNTLLGTCNPNLTHSQQNFPAVYENGLLMSGCPNYLDYPDWQGYDYPPWSMSAVMASPYQAGWVNFTLDKNWISGGSVCINFNPNFTAATATNINVTNNRWGRIQRGNANGNVLIAKNTMTINMTGNTFEDNGAPYNVRLNG